jgi:dTMP kinase
MRKGFFLTFEGLDGTGKSTQIKYLAAWLTEQGRKVTLTRQPGGTVIGDRIRALLLDSKNSQLAPKTELGLMFSDRAQGIAEVILPALEAGHVVLCDRYTDSSEAYQGGGRQLGSETVLELHRVLCGNLQPDLTFLLHPPASEALGRARRRNERTHASTGTDENRFESEQDAFYDRVAAKYEEIAAREPQRVVKLGSGSIEEIQAQIIDILSERLLKIDSAII